MLFLFLGSENGDITAWAKLTATKVQINSLNNQNLREAIVTWCNQSTDPDSEYTLRIGDILDITKEDEINHLEGFQDEDILILAHGTRQNSWPGIFESSLSVAPDPGKF